MAQSSEWQRIKAECAAAGVAGSDDFGKFVSDTRFLDPSAFDERAAMPTLLRLLPTVTEAQVACTIASHLRRPWARPDAFDALHDAFHQWAASAPSDGWGIGDSLANAANAARVDELLKIATDSRFGRTRQMIVSSLWRFKKDPRVRPALVPLLNDADVALHAASALRRVVGNAGALPILAAALDMSTDSSVAEQLAREIKKAQKAVQRG